MDKGWIQTIRPKDKEAGDYASRKEKGRRLDSIKVCVDTSKQGLEVYIEKSNKILITVATISISNINTDSKQQKTRNQK